MSEDFKSDMELMRSVQQHFEKKRTAQAISLETYRKAVEQNVKELEKKGKKGEDLDLLL